MEMVKLVSVIIPTYKRSDTLPRAINSVLNQTYKSIEIIVVDDNDPLTEFRGATEKVMEQYLENPYVTYIKHEKNKNGSAARNTGFMSSNGEYIMFLDDDDEFLPRKISEQVKCMEKKDKSWGACYSSYLRKKDNKVVMRCAETREGALLVEELKRNLFVHAGSNLMIRREVFKQLNGFDETFSRNQDVEFLVRLLKKYKLAYVDVVGLIVYMHPKEMKQSLEDLTTQYKQKFYGYINELDMKQQKEIFRMLNLQIFRSKISNKSQILDGLKMLRKREVLILDAIRYIIHLLVRKLTKKSYGFNL
jgi:glycosyltransferase involved in cell wall biosynthesis